MLLQREEGKSLLPEHLLSVLHPWLQTATFLRKERQKMVFPPEKESWLANATPK